MAQNEKRLAGLVPQRAASTTGMRSECDVPTLNDAVQPVPALSVVPPLSTRRSTAVSNSWSRPCCCWRGGDRVAASCLSCASWRRLLQALGDRKRQHRHGVSA